MQESLRFRVACKTAAGVLGTELVILFAGVQAFKGLEALVANQWIWAVFALSILPLIAFWQAFTRPGAVRHFWERIRHPRWNFSPEDDILTGALHNYRCRFANPADSDRINEMARAFWKEELAIADDVLLKWIEKSKTSFRVVGRLDESGRETEIVGYSAMLSISNSTYHGLKTCQISETDLTESDISSPMPGTGEVLYILDVALTDNEVIRAALVRDVIRHIHHILRSRNNIKKVAAWILTARGKAVANALNLKMQSRHKTLRNTGFYDIENPTTFFSAASSSDYIKQVLREPFQPEHNILR